MYRRKITQPPTFSTLKTQGSVTPDSWTHGSSAMRQHWLAVGFKTGDPAQCQAVFSNGQ